MKPTIRTIHVGQHHVVDGLSGYLQALGVLNDNEEVTCVQSHATDTSTGKVTYQLIVETK